MKNTGDLKDKAVLLGWVAGLLAVIAAIWILTQTFQANNLLRTVNTVFINSGDSRRLLSYEGKSKEQTGLLGYWYSMYNSFDKFFVFTFFQDGILIPLGAVVSTNGTVQEVIPLSAHAMQTFEKIPNNILRIYVTRIEAEALVNTRGINR